MTDLTDLKRRLQGFLQNKQPAQIAKVYRAIVEIEPGFCLVPGVQFDLGRYLERGGFPQLALEAYGALIAAHPNAPITAQAQLQAARLCALLPGQDERGRAYIESYLRTSPADPDREEAIRLLAAFRGEGGLVISSPPRHSVTPASSDEINLTELQHSLVPSPPEGSGPFMDELKSEVSGHEMFFDFAIENGEARNQPSGPVNSIPSAQAEVGDRDSGKNPSLTDPDFAIRGSAAPASAVGGAASAAASPPSRPQSASQFLRRAEELQQQYDDHRRRNEQARQERLASYSEAAFAIILPLQRPVHPKRIAKLLAPYLERTPQRILEIMKNGKGIIFDNLGISAFQDLVRITRPISPDLVYIQISENLQFKPPVDIERLEFTGHGVRVTTQDREISFLWGEALLIGAGRVYLDETRSAGKNVADIYLSRERLHLRVWDATFQYKSCGFAFDPLGDRNFYRFMERLAQTAPGDIRFSPTALRMLKQGDSLPQRFESVNSYERYNRWLLLNFYGKRVKI